MASASPPIARSKQEPGGVATPAEPTGSLLGVNAPQGVGVRDAFYSQHVCGHS